MDANLFLLVIVAVAFVMIVLAATREHPTLAICVAAALGALSGYAMAVQSATPPADKSEFTTTTTAMPGAGPPHVVAGTVPQNLSGGAMFPPLSSQPFASDEPYGMLASYPGAIDLDEYDTAPALGHVDRQAGGGNPASQGGVPDGNPFTSNRIAADVAAEACIDDDAIAVYDGDEQNAMQVRARNDQTRVWAGTFRRYEIADRYMREELDEAEDTRWWGRHEV